MSTFNKIAAVLKNFKIEFCILTLIYVYFLASAMPLPFIQLSDAYHIWIPRLTYSLREILNCSIPFWNEYQFCGAALLADGNTNVLNPMFLFYFFMKPEWAYALSTLVLFLVLITGTWFYFQERGFSRKASLIGTIGYVYSGQIIFWSLYHGFNLSLTLFPVALLAFRRFERTNETKWKVYAFLVVLLSCLGGWIQLSLIAAFSIIIEGVDSLNFVDIKKVLKTRFLTIFLAVFSAAVIIIPTFESCLFSHRNFIPYFKELFPTKLNLVLMTLWGTSFGGHSCYPNCFYYIGIVLIALAIFTIRKSRAQVILNPYFLYSLIFPALLIFIYTGSLPKGFQFGIESDPWRGMFVFILSLSILAAKGTEIYLKRLETRDKIILLPFELFISGIVCLSMIFHRRTLPKHTLVPDEVMVVTLGILILIGFIFPFIFYKIFARYKAIFFSNWLVLLIIFNGFYASNLYIKANIFHGDKMISPWEKEDLPVDILSGGGRFVNLSPDYNYLEEWGIYHKIRSIGGYGSFLPRAIFLRMKADNLLPLNEFMHFKNDNNINPLLLAKYGVLYLIMDKRVLINPRQLGWQFFKAQGKYFIYTNPNYLGRAYIIDEEGNIIKGAKIVKNTSSYVKISVEADAGDTLILSDSWFPGWKCYDNGKKTKFFDANGLRGCYIEEAGLHEIEWIYRPFSFLFGFVVSITCLILFFYLYSDARKPRSSERG